MIKKILVFLSAIVLGIGLGELLWITVFKGTEKLEVRNDFPQEPQGTYSGFYYNNLENDEKIAYELIMAEIEKLPPKVRVPEIDEEGLSDVFDALHYDNAHFFFLGDNCTIETTNFGTSYFVPEYTMTREEYESSMQKLEKVKNMVLARTQNLTDEYDKELFVHDYIVKKCDYEEKVGGTHSSSYGCLVNGSASCEGYAKAMKYLLDAMDIENYLAYGTTRNDSGKDEGHAWNIVKINSDYYHVDVTWNDPVNAEIENRYAYFNVNDEELSETHEIDERFKGICVEDDENYYVKNEIEFSVYDEKTRDSIVSELARQIRLGENTVSFKMSDEDSLKKAERELFDMNGIYSIMLSASSVAGKTLTQEDVLYAIDDTHMIILITDYFKK